MANLNVAYAELTGTAAKLASGAFAAAYDAFTTGAKTTIGGIEQMCTFLTKAAEGFTSTDDALASSLQ